MKVALLTLTLSLLSTIATAQAVTFRGQVEDIQGTQNRYFVDCTSVELISPNQNLAPFIGVQTEIVGTWNGNSATPSVTIQSIVAFAESFEIGGGGKINEDLTFGVTGTAGRLTAIFGSLGSSFLPFGAAGALLIDLGSAKPIAAGIIPAQGQFEVKFRVPNDPNLVGTTIFGQAGILEGPGRLFLTNNDCKTIRD